MESDDAYWAGVVVAAIIILVKYGAAGVALIFLAFLSWLYVLYAIIDRVFG